MLKRTAKTVNRITVTLGYASFGLSVFLFNHTVELARSGEVLTVIRMSETCSFVDSEDKPQVAKGLETPQDMMQQLAGY